MKHPEHFEKLAYIAHYFMLIKPEMKKYLESLSDFAPQSYAGPRRKGRKTDALCYLDDLKCSCLLFAGSSNKKDIAGRVEFMTALHAMCHTLGSILEERGLTDMEEVRQLYGPLSDSLEPDKPVGPDTGYCRNIETTEYLIKLRDICRKRLSAMPGYRAVAGRMKKYARLYIEFQSCKYQPLKTRESHLGMWSGIYSRQFPDISFWEYASAADSLLGIGSMLLLSSLPSPSDEDMCMLDRIYMPWICAYQRMLHYYVKAREDIMTGRMNLTGFYKNLKSCEERLRFLARKAAEASVSQSPDIHGFLVQALPVIYLSDSRACFGLNRLASRNIMRDTFLSARSFWAFARFLNAFR